MEEPGSALRVSGRSHESHDGASRPPTYSTAGLDSLVCPVLVDSSELQSCLPAGAQVSLPPLPHVPEGRHPVIVEIWRVRNGVIEVDRVTAHEWSEMAGGAAGLGLGGSVGAALGAGLGSASGAAGGGALGMWLGPLGWWWGATAGAAAGAAAGSTVMAITGAMRGARWAADAARRTSEVSSQIIGTYNEIVVTVPCRLVQRGGLTSDFAFVLSTCTDSTASMLGEWLLGWGYRKSVAFGARAHDGALEVRIGSSATPFRVVSRASSPPVPPAVALPIATHVLRSLSLPLLGALSEDRLMVSFLDRSFAAQTVRVTPAFVRMEAGDDFLPGIGGFSSDIEPMGSRAPWGAFLVTGLPLTLSYPRAVDR